MGHALWKEADAVLAGGSRIKEQLMMWGKDDDMKVIHIEIDPVEMTRTHTPDVGIIGDASKTLQALQGRYQPGQLLDSAHTRTGPPTRESTRRGEGLWPI